jgi:hypothetical protein
LQKFPRRVAERLIARLQKRLQAKEKKGQSIALDDFLQPVTQLEKGGHVDAALDVLYDRTDDLLKKNEFETIDALLQQAKVNLMSVDIILGLLTATLPVRSKLSARSKFYTEAEVSIKARGAWENGLLAGLES